MTKQIFTRPNAWDGMKHELAFIFLEPDKQVVLAARNAIWSFAAIDGCYLCRNREPADQQRFQNIDIPEVENSLLGIAQTDFGTLPCSTSIVWGVDGLETWLYFGIPIGSLRYHLPVEGFPMHDGTDLSWRNVVDEWLLGLAEHVFQDVSFDIALVGWTDVYGCTGMDFIPMPTDRWCGFIEPIDGRLTWHPPNQRAPLGP